MIFSEWTQLQHGQTAMKQKRAFTLIELLVVISIIGVLAGLILPALSTAKQYAKAATCINNLKQWGNALHIYTADNKDFLPPDGFANPETPANFVSGWYVQLADEMKLQPVYTMPWYTNGNINPDNSVWICPNNKLRSNGFELFHYCLNGFVDGTGTNKPTTLSSFQIPPASFICLRRRINRQLRRSLPEAGFVQLCTIMARIFSFSTRTLPISRPANIGILPPAGRLPIIHPLSGFRNEPPNPFRVCECEDLPSARRAKRHALEVFRSAVQILCCCVDDHPCRKSGLGTEYHRV